MIVQQLFDQAAQTYDQARRQLVPCFDEFYSAVIQLIPFSPNDPIRILDLGAGTGLLTALVAQAFPNACFILADIAPEMLNKARERFANQPNRFSYQVLDYARQPLSGSYHVVMSALSIHHLTDADKLQTFQKIYHALQPDGIFINADQVLGDTPAINSCYYNTWLRQVKEKGVSQSDLSAALERMKEDKYAPLAVQLAWLRQLGLHDVHCWYKNYSFTVYSGRR